MLSVDYVKENVIKLLPIDSSLYDDQIEILVTASMNRLMNEGVDFNKIDEESSTALDYVVCCSYQVAMDIDMDVDTARMTQQYITRVNTLRTALIDV